MLRNKLMPANQQILLARTCSVRQARKSASIKNKELNKSGGEQLVSSSPSKLTLQEMLRGHFYENGSC
jgi:hypothetical protein